MSQNENKNNIIINNINNINENNDNNNNNNIIINNENEDENIIINTTYTHKINNKKLLNEIINQFKTKEFKIKSYKNIFDLKTQLLDYNEYLEKSIKEKQKEIENFKKDYKEILNFNE